MSNKDLVLGASKIRVVTRCRNTIGQRGVLGIRTQPNHPGDDLEGILLSTADGLLYGCGDAVIGVNPAAESVEAVAAILRGLDRLISALEIPTQACCLAHITTQLACLDHQCPVDLLVPVHRGNRGSQSQFGGRPGHTPRGPPTRARGASAARVRSAAEQVMYFETGRARRFPPGASEALISSLSRPMPTGWHGALDPFLVNSVVGFIGPEYLFDERQIVRAGMEDHFIGKLLGLPMGVDVCYTNHAEADQNSAENLLMLLTAAGCNYFMGVPCSDDVMLNYQSTSFHDALAMSRLFGLRPATEFAAWLRSAWPAGRSDLRSHRTGPGIELLRQLQAVLAHARGQRGMTHSHVRTRFATNRQAALAWLCPGAGSPPDGFSNYAISLSAICILAGGVPRFILACAAWAERHRPGLATGRPVLAVVAATMGQLASTFPTAGGLYHWSSILGGRGWGWATAWFNLAGLVTVLAAINVGTYRFALGAFGPPAGTLSPCERLWHPGGVGGRDHRISGCHQPPGNRHHGAAHRLQRLLDRPGRLVLTVCLLAFAPSLDASRLVTFANYSGSTGGDIWPRSEQLLFLFALGALLPAYTITGFDASAHAAEETVAAAHSVPRGIVRSVLVSGIAGWVFLAAVVVAAPSVAEAAGRGEGAFLWIVRQVIPRPLSTGLIIGIIVAQFLCGLATL